MNSSPLNHPNSAVCTQKDCWCLEPNPLYLESGLKFIMANPGDGRSSLWISFGRIGQIQCVPWPHSCNTLDLQNSSYPTQLHAISALNISLFLIGYNHTHNSRYQLLLTKFGMNFVKLNQFKSTAPLQIIEPMTSKWCQKCSPLQTIEELLTRLCFFWWAEKPSLRVWKYFVK